MEFFADLHIHSCFSIASSASMRPDSLRASCARKGIGVLGSGDALHPGWRKLWVEEGEDDAGVLVVPTAEVEDRNRVHHLIIMETFEAFGDLQEVLAPHAKNLALTGRPHVSLSGEKIARSVHTLSGLIGPAHAFTPWTSLYAMFDAPAACYGGEKIDFLELGLSADSSYGTAIPELSGVPFLSSSDAHSPDPSRLGREFTGISLRARTARGVIGAIRENAVSLNAGFFPEVGKYNRTACSRCYTQYTVEEAIRSGWRCPADRGRIKKGVGDRARELSTGIPEKRPPYIHIIPLGEIISRVLGTSSPGTKRCRALYDRFIGEFGTEIRVLTMVPVDDLAGVDQDIARAIDAFRSSRIQLIPGGGGCYGSFSFR
jgi:uncharacterized protein (TIGR00375 family)